MWSIDDDGQFRHNSSVHLLKIRFSFVRFHTYGENGVTGTVILRGREFSDQYRIKHEFLARLHERFQREGVTFPVPARTVRLRRDKEGGAS